MEAGGAATVRVQELMGRVVVDGAGRRLGRVVVDGAGRRLGRVVECLAEPRGDELCVTALLIGPGAWRGRFGPGRGNHGRRVSWDAITALAPHITVRLPAETADGEG